MSSLTQAQLDIIPHIIKHVYPLDAARSTGLDESVMNRWLQSPAFRQELAYQRKLAATHVMHALEKYANAAVKKLYTLSQEGTTEAIQLKASDSLLTHLIQFKSQYGIESRLEALETLQIAATKIKEQHAMPPCQPSLSA